MIGDNNPVQYCEVSDEGIDKYPRNLALSATICIFAVENCENGLRLGN